MGWDNNYARGRDRTHEGYSTSEYMFMRVYKAFSENWRRTAPRLGAMAPGNNNDDAGAVYAAAERLAARPEARKVLLVLSDGAPSHTGTYHAEKHLKDAVRRVTAAGIDTAGLGIQSTEVRKFYPVHAVTHDLSDLATSAINLLKQLLTSRRGA